MSYDFGVAREKLMTKAGSYVGRDALLREDTGALLSVVSSTYKVVPHMDAVAKAEEALASIGVFERKNEIITSDGARLFIEYTFPEIQAEVVKNDIVSLKSTLRNSYDETVEFGFMFGAFRLVCKNGLTIMTAGAKFSRRHTVGLDINSIINTIRQAADIFVNKAMPKYRELASEVVHTRAFMAEIMAKKVLPDKLVESAITCLRPGESDRASRWAIYNAFTYHLTHQYNKSYERRISLEAAVADVFLS